MLTSIVILTLNKLDFTQQCIESIRNHTEPGSYEIIVVDNKSKDGTVEWLRQQPDIHLIANDYNAGFPAGCNQGIEVAQGENILLLNNDTIVTKNWLTNMLQALYSNEKVGAVGPVTNNCSYYQQISVEYDSLDQMHQFAAKYNVADASKWERRVKLVGYCMLIKKEVIDSVGLLDEIFTPGNFEDDDYSFRMLQAGYTLLLCKDTFIHHYGSVSFKENNTAYSDLLQKNRQKFLDKWGFDSPYSTGIRFDIIELFDDSKDSDLNVLEVGCATGATLLNIKYIFPNANLFGIELNASAASIAKTFADVRASNIEEDLDFPENHFDYIIFGDVLEHLYDPWIVLRKIKKYLTKNGKIIASLPNVMHHSLLRSLLHGQWTYTDAGLLDRTHVRFFTLQEIITMFQEAGYYNIEYKTNTIHTSRGDEQWIDSLVQLTTEELRKQYNAYQYVVKVYKNEGYTLEQLKFLIRRIENEIEIEQNLLEFLENLREGNFNVNDIIKIVVNDIYLKDTVLNKLAVTCYNNELYDAVIPLLEKSLEINSVNADTLYNIGYILYSLNEKDSALVYLEQIMDPDLEVLNLLETLKKELENE